MSRLDALLARVLADGAELSVTALLAAVRADGGHGVSRAALERLLRASDAYEPVGDGHRTHWRATTIGSPGPAPLGAPDRSDASRPGAREGLEALELRTWQAEALAAWSATGQGVVEAVTGTGKTRLALAAVRLVLPRGARTLVLVPTLELQQQWVGQLRALVPDARVGRLGGGGSDDLDAFDVVVATPHSAATLPIEPPAGRAGLLIADEAHRYGAPSWGAALRASYDLRLALTATYERADEGVADVLAPYFGAVVFRYDYARAVAEGTIAPFAVAIAGVRLDPAERERYATADRRARALRRQLVGAFRMPEEPHALFAAVAAVVADALRHQREDAKVSACREYLSRVRERRDVAATAAGKLAVCAAVGPALRDRRSLVFTDTVAQADDAVRILRSAGVHAEAVHGGLSDERRRIRLAQFRRGRVDTLVAPRVLDEGVDVPEADVAVVLAAFRTRRQMIQRLGRVLRPKVGGGEARLVLAVALDTAEDPSAGGHDGFLSEVRGVAREVRHLDVDRAPDELARWLGEPGHTAARGT